MIEFSDSLPASELEHLWPVNTFVCMHLSPVSLWRRERDSNNFQFSSPLHFTGNEKVFIQHTKTVSLKKIEKKTSISHSWSAKRRWSESHLADWRKRIQKRCSTGSVRFWRLQSSCTWKNCMMNAIPTLWLPIQKWKPQVTLVKRSEDVNNFYFQSLFFLSCSRHHAPEVLWI